MRIKLLLRILPLLVASIAWGQTTFSNLDDNGNWGSCTVCAGGNQATYWMAQNQTRPSVDGASTEFYISGPQYSDALFWNKVGPYDSFSNFQTDFYVRVDSNAQHYAQALEFDTFQFANGTEYMFGTQCNYVTGTWQVWNQQAGQWNNLGIMCPKFTPNTWYRIIWQFHRTPDLQMSYDSLEVLQYSGGSIVSNNIYHLNVTYPSGPMPVGWTDNLGVQFQLDLNGNGGSFSEWVDKVNLTAW